MRSMAGCLNYRIKPRWKVDLALPRLLRGNGPVYLVRDAGHDFAMFYIKRKPAAHAAKARSARLWRVHFAESGRPHDWQWGYSYVPLCSAQEDSRRRCGPAGLECPMFNFEPVTP